MAHEDSSFQVINSLSIANLTSNNEAAHDSGGGGLDSNNLHNEVPYATSSPGSQLYVHHFDLNGLEFAGLDDLDNLGGHHIDLDLPTAQDQEDTNAADFASAAADFGGLNFDLGSLDSLLSENGLSGGLLGASIQDPNDLAHLGGDSPVKGSFEDQLNDLDLDLDLNSLFSGNDTDDGLEKLLDTFTKEFGQGEEVSDEVFYTLVIVYGVVITLGLVGNVVILYAILSKRVMRTARNYFILCLASSDLLLCAFTMPLTLWEVLSRKWIFGKDLQWLCQLAHSCQGTPVFLSSMAIVAIAVDRYRCIMQPDKPHFSSGVALLISFGMAIASILLSLPMYITAQVKTFIEFPDATNMEDILICQDTWEGSLKVVYTVISSCAQFLLPVILVISLYLSIYLKLKNRPQSQHAENNEKRRRTNIMILSVTVIFFVSWLPLNVFNFLMDMYPEEMKDMIAGNETVVYALLHLFGLCNALTNPILYGYLNENFRKEYKNIYRQMPWHSSTKDAGLELAVHYHVLNGGHASPRKEGRKHSAAILTIDKNNVNVIGPASIAQRLMYAAVAAAAAAPKNDDDDLDDSEEDKKEEEGCQASSSTSSATPDSPTAEAVAKAFLDSVDRYMTIDEANEAAAEMGEGREPQPYASHHHHGISGILYLSSNGQQNMVIENEATEPLCEAENHDNEEELQVVLVAPRPNKKRKGRASSTSSAPSSKWTSSSVKILSIEAFRKGQGLNGHHRLYQKAEDETSPVSGSRRLFSIPDVLLNATLAAQSHSTASSRSTAPPRTRVVNIFANSEHVRPVYSPFCHPIDLEGLQETAV